MAVVCSLRLLTGAADQPSVVMIDTMAAANDDVPIPSDVKTVFPGSLFVLLASQPAPLQCIDIRQYGIERTVCRYNCGPLRINRRRLSQRL